MTIGITMAAMGLLIVALLGYFVLRRVVPNATFYSLMMVDSKVLVVLLIVVSMLIGLTAHIQLADVLLFALVFVFLIIVSRKYPQSADDAPRSFPFLASLASRAPPAF
jgi:hypothetical protein